MTRVMQLAHDVETEAGRTRAMLAAVPDDKLGYRAHPRSYSIGQVASHLAESMGWVEAMTDMDAFEMDPTEYTPFEAGSTAELLETFDANAAGALTKIRGLEDGQLDERWVMTVQGQPVMDTTRGAVLREIMVHHAIHHRAQLGVYLRLNDVTLPPLYGPTADDPSMGG